MKLRKTTNVVLLSLLSLVGLVGCNGKNDGGKVGDLDYLSSLTRDDSQKDTSKDDNDPNYVAPTPVDYDGSNVTVTWWNNYKNPFTDKKEEEGGETTRTNKTYNEYWFAHDVIEEFKKVKPNITIEMAYHGAYGAIVDDVKSAIPNGLQPTMVSLYPDNVAVFQSIDENSVYDMTGYGKLLEQDSDFNQNYLKAERDIYGGKKYLSLPYSKSAETLVLNKSVFDLVGAGKAGVDDTKAGGYVAPVAVESKTKYKVPENFYEMIDVARKMKADFPSKFENQKDADGYFKAVPFCWDSTENMFITLMENTGVGYTNRNKESLADKLTFNTAEKVKTAKDLLVQLKKWNNEGLICTQNQLPITDASKGYHAYSSNMSVTGDIFMSVSSTAGTRYYAKDGCFLSSFEHGLNWASNSNAKDAKVISQGPSLAFLKDKNPQVNAAAFEFYKFLTNAENSANLAQKTTYFPVRDSSYDKDVIKNTTDKAGTSTFESSYNDKLVSYAGDCLKLNKTLSANNNYFMSDVFDKSSVTRTSVGNLINEVFDNKEAKTDDQIKAAVDTAFDNCITKIATD